MSTDSEVIQRSAFEPAEFAALYDRHARAVFRYAAQRLGDHAAEDVASETFMVAFERRSTYDFDKPDARPWLLGIATRLIRKHGRLEATAWKGMVADLAAQVAPDLIDQSSARIDAQRLTHRLAKTLRRLSAADRETLLLYAWGELDYAAIASAMDVPIGTVRSRLNRTRRQIRRAACIDALQQETDHGRTDTAPQNA